MPTVEFQGTEIDCEEGTILRDVLLEAGESPHNGRTSTINCFGHGSCGTCAVDVGVVRRHRQPDPLAGRRLARLALDVDRTGATGAVPETVDRVRAAVVR